MQLRYILALLSLLASFLVPALAQAHLQDDADQLNAIMDEHFEALIRRFPLTMGSNRGDLRFNDKLFDPSPQAQASWLVQIADRLERLQTLDLDSLTTPQRLDAELLIYNLQRTNQSAQFHAEQIPITTLSGPHINGPQIARFSPVSNEKQIADYAARLEAYPDVIDKLIQQMRLGMASGRVPPRVTVEPAIEQTRALGDESYANNPRQSPFFKPMTRHLDSPTVGRIERTIAKGIVPAYQKLATFLENEYVPAARASFGYSQGVDGIQAYNNALAMHTTTNLTADQIHQIGLDEVTRIRKLMFQTIARSDFPQRQSLQDQALFDAFTTYLRTDKRFYHTTEDQLLMSYRNISKIVDGELPKLFSTLPRLSYGVRPIPAYASANAPTAYYYPGSLKSGMAGSFMANVANLDQRPSYDAMALTFHEAVPGHHLQISLAREMQSVHPLRTTYRYSAYVEGWALYAEGLGLEMGEDPQYGLYTNAYDDFGRLNMEMWRALRLVVDTGLHAFGWTREQAIQYMAANSALTAHNIKAEVDRYIGWPGQACGYKIGQLTILKLRRQAEQRLGKAFDVRAFHEAVLGNGPLPLPVLQTHVQRWIESQLSDL